MKVYTRWKTYAEIGPPHAHKVGDVVDLPEVLHYGELRPARQAEVKRVDNHGIAYAFYLEGKDESQQSFEDNTEATQEDEQRTEAQAAEDANAR